MFIVCMQNVCCVSKDKNMIDFKEIPDWWPLCPGYECTQRENCLRHLAFRQAPKGVTRWECVLPTALDSDSCCYYQKAGRVRMAMGFDNLCQQLHSRDARHDIRIALTDYFGSKGSYYRHKNGEMMLTPEQQDMVGEIFRRYGFEADFVFDKYEERHDFTTV